MHLITLADRSQRSYNAFALTRALYVVVTDYFAELYVVGRFADKGWNVYLPHRDKGFDFIVSKQTEVGDYVIRPVQLKGKYPTASKRNWPVYGYTERLSTLHPEMVLAIPYFAHGETSGPVCVAYCRAPWYASTRAATGVSRRYFEMAHPFRGVTTLSSSMLAA